MAKHASMRFWELVSVFCDESHIIKATLQDERWAEYRRWYDQYSLFVGPQNREILDAEIPDELCRNIVSQSIKKYALFRGENLRRGEQPHPLGETPLEVLSALEIYDRFGGRCFEEIKEFGSYIIGRPIA